MDYELLYDLKNKVKNKTATKQETDLFMKMLYDNGSLLEKDYNEYLSNTEIEENIKTALLVGAALLLVYLVAKALNR